MSLSVTSNPWEMEAGDQGSPLGIVVGNLYFLTLITHFPSDITFPAPALLLQMISLVNSLRQVLLSDSALGWRGAQTKSSWKIWGALTFLNQQSAGFCQHK